MISLSATARADVRGRLWNGDEPAGHAAILLDGDAPSPPPARAAQLDEVWLSFVPKIQVVPPGSTLTFTARDADSHTVHAWYGKETLFNRASVPNGPRQSAVLDRPGLVSVTCDLHAEMRAWVLVSASPYSAVTDVDGRFVVAAPAGRHQVRVWRPGDAQPIDLGELPLDGEVELHAPRLAVAPVNVSHSSASSSSSTGERTILPGWMRWLGARPSWPAGRAAYVLSVVGAPVGFALAWAIFWLAARRRWSIATSVLLGCGLAFLCGATSALGLSAAVATALGFGAFMGTIIAGAHRMA